MIRLRFRLLDQARDLVVQQLPAPLLLTIALERGLPDLQELQDVVAPFVEHEQRLEKGDGVFM